MNFGKMLGEDLDGIALGDDANDRMGAIEQPYNPQGGYYLDYIRGDGFLTGKHFADAQRGSRIKGKNKMNGLAEDLEGLASCFVVPGTGSRGWDPRRPHRGRPPTVQCHGLEGMGATTPLFNQYPLNQTPLGAPYRYGTRNWWQWYATVYLPQYYSQQQVYALLLRHALYSTFGLPTQYAQYAPQTYYPQQYPTQYPYTGNQYNQYYAQQYSYPQQYYGQQYGYYDPSQPYYGYGQQNLQYQGEVGSAQCQQQGGFYDFTQQTCYGSGGQPVGNTYGQVGNPPNVIGQTVAQAVAALNQAGFNVWERVRDGVSQGMPQGTVANRVVIDDNQSVVTAQYMG